MEESIVKLVRETFELREPDLKTYSPLTLAYIGDAIYDLVIRTMVVEKGNTAPNKLHKKTSEIVKAKSQAEAYEKIKDVLSEEETEAFRRGRNAKSYTMAKNASMSDYRKATGFEALLGYLYLSDRMDRVMELTALALETKANKK
ncbi:MAG: ribonuclease III [Lachnospiraceae bacterium]|nr:ribonuclease III [Lachnospiraceae bacterium]